MFDAELVVLALVEAGLPIGDFVAYAAETDPNELLGRPGGYTSKVNFHDTRLEMSDDFSVESGGSVEVFDDRSAAAERLTYISGISDSNPALFGEYDFLVGTVLLRVSFSLTPEEAAQYETALSEVTRALAAGEIPAAVSAATTLPSGSVEAADALASPFVDGVSPPLLPEGTDGALEVIAIGNYDGTILPIVVRNRFPNSVLRIEVSAVARDQDGILATGSDQGLSPNLVAPGEIAFGYIYFDSADLPTDVGYEFTVTAEDVDGGFAEFENIVDLTPISHQVRDGRLLGELQNDDDATVSGPIEVAVICFSEAGSILDHHSDFTDQDQVAAGSTLPFSVELFDEPCPGYLVAASGFEN